MFSPSNDASCHFDSHILSWKNCSLKKEEVLSKINAIVTEYTARCYNLDQPTHYDFVSMHSLRDHKKVYQSKISSSDMEKGIFCNQFIFF